MAFSFRYPIKNRYALKATIVLRQGSIIPAAIAHTAWNILSAVQEHFDVQWELEFRFTLAAALAYALFRFWPAKVEAGTQDVNPNAASEVEFASPSELQLDQ